MQFSVCLMAINIYGCFEARMEALESAETLSRASYTLAGASLDALESIQDVLDAVGSIHDHLKSVQNAPDSVQDTLNNVADALDSVLDAPESVEDALERLQSAVEIFLGCKNQRSTYGRQCLQLPVRRLTRALGGCKQLKLSSSKKQPAAGRPTTLR